MMCRRSTTSDSQQTPVSKRFVVIVYTKGGDNNGTTIMFGNSFIRITVLTTLMTASAEAATFHVDQAHPKANDNGNGTVEAPFKTLGAAVPHLAPGDSLLIGSGVYRESLNLRDALLLQGTTGGVAQTKIEARTNANVIIRGSDIVTNWERVSPGVFVKRDWGINSQQVFVNGVALKQIGGAVFGDYPNDPNHPYANMHATQGGIWPGRSAGDENQLVDNSFHYDAASRRLYIKFPADSLSGRRVEVSVRTYSLLGEGLRNILFRNLRFEHSNTTAVHNTGAVTLSGDALVLDGVHVSYADGAGFDVSGNNNIIRSSSANYCGQLGIKARGKGVRILNNQTHYNNTRGFNKWWEAGGMKLVGDGGLQDSQVVGHHAYGNNGDGIWFDWQNRNNTISGNRIAYNKGMGLHYEASFAARILRNTIFGNAQRGIYLPNSSDSVIAHNLIADNALEGIAIVDERQAVEQGRAELIPDRNYVAGNVIVRNGGTALVLPGKNIVNNVTDANLYLTTNAWLTFSWGWISSINPVVAGLPAWQALSQQCFHAWHETLPISTQLARDLELKKPYPDFSQEIAAMSRYTIPRHLLANPVPVSVGTRPGP